ncbi:MAG: HEAT repeat domain-containing protein [Nitrospirae bacterium]|nr:HEAT repeat domain-containing protein [Nitrospirota bacterium]
MHGTAIVDDIEVSRDIAGFLKGDNLSSYVSEGYRRDLARMMASSQAGSADTGGLKAEFKDEALDKATSGVFLELLWSDLITEEDSSGLLARLTELMDIFVDTGRFEDILYIYDAVFSMEYPGKFKDAAISMMENFLSSRQFISRLAGAFILRGKNNMESVVRLANALRLYIVKPLLEILSEETNTGNRKFLLSVLGELGRDILPHAVNKLNDNRWYVIRNMLYLIRQCDGRKYLDHARRFIGHKNTKISMEALKTLLHFHTPDAVSCLKSYLQAEDTAMRTQAINIAGLYRVKDAVSYLLKLLEKKDVRGRDLPLKIQTVKALGRIGDPSVVKSLEKICSSKTLLYKDSLEELKLEIFRTLNGYPRASVMPLIDAGLSSKNEKIRALSMKLLKQTA